MTARTKTKITKRVSLPSVPHKLLDVAIRDLRAASRKSGVVVDPAVWLRQCVKDCVYCLAGAVMLCTLRGRTMQAWRSNKNVYPCNFSLRIAKKLHALNSFSRGYCNDAFRYLRLNDAIGRNFNRDMPDMRTSKFLPSLEKLRDDLKAEGY